jgi:hypothetical protein
MGFPAPSRRSDADGGSCWFATGGRLQHRAALEGRQVDALEEVVHGDVGTGMVPG